MKTLSLVCVLMAMFLLGCQEKTEKKEQIDSSLIENPATANEKAKKGDEKPTMEFEKTMHDFGKINEGAKVAHAFKFTNRGGSPLIISNVVPSCGCTVPEYPKEPVMPGESGFINLVFDSKARSGNFIKNVTIFANTIPNTKELYIKGFIEKNN